MWADPRGAMGTARSSLGQAGRKGSTLATRRAEQRRAHTCLVFVSSRVLRPTHSGWEHLLGGEEGLAGSHARQTLLPHLPCPLVMGEAPRGGRPLPPPRAVGGFIWPGGVGWGWGLGTSRGGQRRGHSPTCTEALRAGSARVVDGTGQD